MKKIIFKNAVSKLVLTAFVIILNLHSFDSLAQWSTNPYINNPICTAAGTQANSIIAADGKGGAIIAWVDDRTGSSIFAQGIDSSGVIKWATDGILICSDTFFRGQASIISDENGGAIITWADYRNGNDFDIYAQRINENGVVQWAKNGVNICSAKGDQSYPIITTDGNGGAIFTWTDSRIFDPIIIPHIYAQGINADGSLKWTEAAICTNIEGQTQPAIVSDGIGGAFIVWKDARNQSDGTSASDIYAQHIGSNGLIQWTTDGLSISKAFRIQENPQLTSDGSGGFIVTWQDERNLNDSFPNNVDIYAQRVKANGDAQWAANGIPICTDKDKQLFEHITSDESNGAIISWVTWNGTGNSATSKICFQRVNGNGTALWQNNGFSVGGGDNQNPVIVSDGFGGTFLVFEAKITSGNEIYAQHISADGLELWSPFGGIIVTNAYGTQNKPHFVLDKNGGIIVSWDDTRNTLYDIFAQHIKPDGTLGGSNATEVKNTQSNQSIFIYPNPVSQELTVDLKTSPFSIVSLIDLTGRTLETVTGNGKIIFKMGTLKPSVYFIQIKDGAHEFSKLLIKK